MNYAALLPALLTAALLGGSLAPPLAHAQYVWLDEQGRKHFSDMPPDPSVPAARILRAPTSAAAPSSNHHSPDSAAAPTLAEREADFRKRRLERMEAEQQAAEDTRRRAENKRRCENLATYLQALESGERIARRERDGERHFLSDAERTRELQQTRRLLNDCQS